jgi:hypothetical protein
LTRAERHARKTFAVGRRKVYPTWRGWSNPKSLMMAADLKRRIDEQRQKGPSSQARATRAIKDAGSTAPQVTVVAGDYDVRSSLSEQLATVAPKGHCSPGLTAEFGGYSLRTLRLLRYGDVLQLAPRD